MKWQTKILIVGVALFLIRYKPFLLIIFSIALLMLEYLLRPFMLDINFESVTLMMIYFAYHKNSLIGFFLAIVLILGYSVIADRMCIQNVLKILVLFIIAMILPLFTAYPFILVALVTVIAVNVVEAVLFAFVGTPIYWNIIYRTMSIATNLFILRLIA